MCRSLVHLRLIGRVLASLLQAVTSNRPCRYSATSLNLIDFEVMPRATPAPGVTRCLIPRVVEGELVALQELDDLIPLLVLVEHRRILRQGIRLDHLPDVDGEVGES